MSLNVTGSAQRFEIWLSARSCNWKTIYLYLRSSDLYFKIFHCLTDTLYLACDNCNPLAISTELKINWKGIRSLLWELAVEFFVLLHGCWLVKLQDEHPGRFNFCCTPSSKILLFHCSKKLFSWGAQMSPVRFVLFVWLFNPAQSHSQSVLICFIQYIVLLQCWTAWELVFQMALY